MCKTIWMLYDACDLVINRGFVSLMQTAAEKHQWQVEAVTVQELTLGFSSYGEPTCTDCRHRPLPAMLLSRQRNAKISRHFEQMGIPVYNSSRVCEICNHKPTTYSFLRGLPMMENQFIQKAERQAAAFGFPCIVKPAGGHGGQGVAAVADEAAYDAALDRIAPDDAVVQRIASDAGKDLRLYVVFGEIICGVMRTAKSGIISNFKLGGEVCFHQPTMQEHALGLQVAERFASHGAPLCFAGIDLIYHEGKPVLNEVEDVVGCRMLYETGSIDIASLFIDRLLANR